MYLKASALVSGAGLIAMYFATTPGRPAEPRPVSRSTAAAQVQAAEDIEELAVRLRARVRAEVAFREPARNPFRFSARRPVPAAAVAGVVPEVVAAPAPPQLPLLSLIGIAADDVDGATERTAIISTGQSVLLVRSGDAVGPGYTVAKVEEDAVELTSTADGTIRRLMFRP